MQSSSSSCYWSVPYTQNENLAKDLQSPVFLGLFFICNLAILPLICKVFEKTKIYFYWDWRDEKLANSSILLLSWFQKWGSFGEMQSQLVCFHISQCLKITKKSLIQHCERSELRLHFQSTKVHKKCQKWSILASFENLKLSVK